jgi:hypothetical protein
MHAAVHHADGKVIVTRQPDTTALAERGLLRHAHAHQR